VDDLERRLEAAGIEVLVDDRDDRPGAKFATMDLIGCPYQLIVGPKGVKAGEVEIKTRRDGSRRALAPDAAVTALIEDVKSGRNLA
jgi:prolyl-tRNA synthetase